MARTFGQESGSRTGWSLRAGDVVRRCESSATYTVVAVFRSYYGGEMQAKIRDQWGSDRTVPAGSVFTTADND